MSRLFGILCGHERKSGDVCGEEFAAQARRERRAYPASGSVRSEQRRLGRKEPPPGGLRPIWPGASLLVSHSPTAGDAPSSRLAPSQMGRNKRHWIYAHGQLGIVVEEELVGVRAQADGVGFLAFVA